VAEPIVVADAGPVLHLHWVGATSWALPPGVIHVVETVWREIEKYDPAPLSDSRLRRVSLSFAVPPELAPFVLDDGERASLGYALSVRATAELLILTDDRRARSACQELGLPYIGSVGLIIEAHAGQLVPAEKAVQALRALPTVGKLWVHPKILDAAVRTVKGA
jgi:predicted nucleic acid-binding protein